MARTPAEKIIACAAGRETVSRGDVVTATVGLATIHDCSGPRRVEPILQGPGVGLFDTSKVVLITDHFVSGDTDRLAPHPKRRFAAKHAKETGQ